MSLISFCSCSGGGVSEGVAAVGFCDAGCGFVVVARGGFGGGGG